MRLRALFCRTLTVATVVLAVSASSLANGPVQGLIWRVTSKDATIYLVGSIHLGDKSMYPLPPIYDVAFDQASALVEEVDPNQLTGPAMMQAMASKAMYPPDDSLVKHLKPATLDRVKAFCQENGLPLERTERLKPWILSMIIPMLPALKAGGFTNANASPGIDMYFANKAAKVHKPVVGIETIEFQIKLLEGLMGDDQDRAILAALDLKPSKGGGFNTIISDWVKGDANAKAIAAELSRAPRAVFQDRNYSMTAMAEKYLKSQTPCLMVVGAGHMLGPEGIVALLRAKGYRVVQILSPR